MAHSVVEWFTSALLVEHLPNPFDRCEALTGVTARLRTEVPNPGPGLDSRLLILPLLACLMSLPVSAADGNDSLGWGDVAAELERVEFPAAKPADEEAAGDLSLDPDVMPTGFDDPGDASVSTGEESSRRTFTFGGGYLQQASVSGISDGRELRFEYSPPGLVDLFLNATPSDHIRGYVLVRLGFDPSLQSEEPLRLILDQLWLRADIENRVFFTLGRQQVVWGPGAIWRPTDFLRSPNLTPLESFDLRTGTDMFRVQVPLPALRTTLNAGTFMQRFTDASEPDVHTRFGAALRLEMDVSLGEVGLSAVFLQQRKPRYGLDVSIGLGGVDLYSAVSLQHDTERRLWQRTAAGFELRRLGSPALQAMAGAYTQWRVLDVYQLGLRVEGFYNRLGYLDRDEMTWLVANGDYEPLQFGRFYGMVQTSLTRRSPLEPTLQLSSMGNVLQRSFFSRMDVSAAPLLGVRFGGFLEVPLGPVGSEFRFEPSEGLDPGSASGRLRTPSVLDHAPARSSCYRVSGVDLAAGGWRCSRRVPPDC